MYDVREDSYLLRNTLNDEGVTGNTAIDIGVGTGVITEALAKTFDTVIGVDIDVEAVNHCKDRFDEDDNVSIYVSDGFKNIPNTTADTITCNPPYLPSTAGEGSDPALDGGETGIEYTVSFLKDALNYVADDGMVYFVASDKADLGNLHDYLDRSTYQYNRVNDTRYFFETLYVYRASITD